MKVPHSIVGRTRPSAQGQQLFSLASFTPEAFGAGIGRGLQQLSAGFAVREQEQKREEEIASAELKQREDRTNRFQTLTNFSEFESNVATRLTELKRNADPTGKGFAALAEAEYKKAEAEFLGAKVHPDLKEEFTYRSSEVRRNMLGDAMDFQYKAGDAFFRTSVDTEYQKALKGLDLATGGDPKQLETYRAKMAETIDATDLSDIEKADLKQKVSIGLEGVGYKQAVKQEIASRGAQAPRRSRQVNAPAHVRNAISQAAQRHGEDPQLLMRISEIESSLNPNAKNPNSSAGGLFQFVDGTANDYGLKNRFDPAEASDAAARLLKDNRAYLQKNLGRAPTNGELYLAHQQGAGGALKLLRDPSARAVDIVGADAIRLNGGNASMTAGEFASKWTSKVDGSGAIYSTVDASGSFSNVPYEDRVALRADAEREVAGMFAEQAKERKLLVDTQINTLLNNIMDGSAGQAQIDRGVEDGWLGDYDQRKKAQDALDTKTKEVDFFKAATDKVNSPLAVFDPTDENDRKMLNAYVGKDGLTKLSGADSAYVTNGLVPLVQRAGDIPTDVVGTLTGMVRSNNQTQALFALETLRQLKDADPRAYDDRIPEKLSNDVDFYSSRKQLYPADELLKSVNGGTDAAERQSRAILDKEAQGYLAAKKNGVSQISTLVADVVGDFSGYTWSAHLSGVPAFAKALESDYQTAFVDAYSRTGNVEEADVLARKTLQKSWGVTVVGGQNLLMKHPPEKVGYRPVAGSYEWINRQVGEEVGLKPGERFELISDDQTETEFRKWQTGGVPPSYRVIVYDEAGTAHLQETRRWFQPTSTDKTAEVKEFEKRNVERDLIDAQNKLEGASMFYGQRGEPIPQEFYDDVEELKGKAKALEPVPVPNLSNEPSLEATPWGAM
jgi:hypothetical protein